MNQPLLPSHVNLLDFPFMPIDINRLFGSEFHANSDDTTFRAGITLWLKSYHQIPAASLPSDDVALARLAELGRDKRTWMKIREGALRGWKLCSDGRLYHKVVAEKALEAWIEKIAQRKVSGAGNAKRYKQEFDPKPFDDDLELARAHLAAINPQSRMLARKGGKYALGTPGGTPKVDEIPPSGSVKPPDGKPAGGSTATQNLPIRKGREEKGSKSLKEEYLSPLGRATDLALDLFFEVFPQRAEEDGVRRELGRRLADGVDFQDILTGARYYASICLGRAPEHVASPVKWLVDSRWKDRRTKPSEAPGGLDDGKVFVGRDDSRWPQMKARYRQEKGKDPPDFNGGWRFPKLWLVELHEGVS